MALGRSRPPRLLRVVQGAGRSPEPAYDALAALAELLCDTPMAAITLVDAGRQWFKSKHGISLDEIPRSISFCSMSSPHALPWRWVMPGCTAGTAANPLVTGPAHIRGYLAVPLVGRDGLPFGALCVIMWGRGG